MPLSAGQACRPEGGDGAPSQQLYSEIPGSSFSDTSVSVGYHTLELDATAIDELVAYVRDKTPLPMGRDAFSSTHVIGPAAGVSIAADALLNRFDAEAARQEDLRTYRLDAAACGPSTTTMAAEYEAIFGICSELILQKADRASLLIFVGWEDTEKEALAAFIGMLPYRGVSLALLSRRAEHGSLTRYTTCSGGFEVDALDAARMGMFPIKAVFGALSPTRQTVAVNKWNPVSTAACLSDPAAEELPFKIGGRILPMVTHNAEYAKAVAVLGATIRAHYAEGSLFPIVCCGETCDALGYGYDVFRALGGADGCYFTHRSGEMNKRFEEYGKPELFAAILRAKANGQRPVIVAVGGGVNGNCAGLIAALTGADFVEVPTTLMHYNDATTSAKKAFSLVRDGKILSKNILGAFYLPQLVFCVNEMMLTLSSASAHSTVGEATKTMNMLGIANSDAGANDYFNILGAKEFASDFTRILLTVEGFDDLCAFIGDGRVASAKREIIALGRAVAAERSRVEVPSTAKLTMYARNDSAVSLAEENASQPDDRRESGVFSSPSSSGSSSDDDGSTGKTWLETLESKRADAIAHYRSLFHALPAAKKAGIKGFLTTINKEVVKAKAMFLAYSDPFEKYRALLFEYAHTLGHGVEAVVNGLYARLEATGEAVPEDAFKLHGQFVGLAVQWAGQMSANLGVLNGEGFELHQSFVYLFNRHGGFNFAPLRRLCDRLGVDKAEFIEEVLKVVRRDNKRGYCKATDPSKSVDQLVAGRPGKMLRSDDANAELRYLVEVDESWQAKVLGMGFDCEFDLVADLESSGELVFRPELDAGAVPSGAVANHIHSKIKELYAV